MISTETEKRLRTLVDVFLAENKKLNLSAFRTAEHCWIGNVLDSVSLLKALQEMRGFTLPKKLLDIGTGGGFPLLPLAICWPETECVGLDATTKKIDAIGRIKETMHLENVKLVCGRAEEIGHQAEYRGQFDLITARAVGSIPVLLEYAIPLLKLGGICALWKSTKVAEELASSGIAQRALRSQFAGTFEYELPGDFGKRLLIFFKKAAPTPKEYPRKTGIPKQQPL